jgi:hypothetical protein
MICESNTTVQTWNVATPLPHEYAYCRKLIQLRSADNPLYCAMPE